MNKETLFENKEFEIKIRMIMAGEISIDDSGLDVEEIDDSSYQQLKAECSCMMV